MYKVKYLNKLRSKTTQNKIHAPDQEKTNKGSLKQVQEQMNKIVNRDFTPSPSSRQNNQEGKKQLKECLTDKYGQINQPYETTNSFYLNENKSIINNQSQVSDITTQQTGFLPSTSSIFIVTSSKQNNQLKEGTSQCQQELSITNQLQSYQIKSKELINCKQNKSIHNSFLSNNLSNKKKNSISNIAFTTKTADSLQNSQEKKLNCVKAAKNNQNSTFLKIMSKSLLNTSISDDQLSYEDGYNRKISSSFKNICENEGVVFMEQKKLKNSVASYSFLENSYKHSGNSNYTSYLFSPFLVNSDIIDESCIPERCQNPLSKDIQFLNLSNQESNFEELKKKILFEEDLSDFEL